MTVAKEESPAQTEEQRREEALQQLAVIGGKLTGEDDVTYSGTKFVIPQHLSLQEGIDFLEQRKEDEENEHRFTRSFNYRPHDGARATAAALREAFGFTIGKTLWSFFGRQRPELIDVAVSHNETEQVPWGAMRIPGMKGCTLHLGSTRHKVYGEVFQIVVDAPRKWRFHIEGLFKLIEQHLKRDSIYRGKAIDGDGQFIDTSVVDPNLLVYTDSVMRRLEGDLWSFIRYGAQLEEYGQQNRYAVLLEGPFGSGKTEAAGVTAQIANAAGWTFLMCRPGKDDLEQALQMARLYPPAVVFAEDVDVRADADSFGIAECLDMMDGFHTKGQKLVAVFTTNNADRIHAGMLRPGRIGAVIHLGAMDEKGIRTLAERVVGDALADDVDWAEVAEHMDGYMPAFVKEAFNRSVRYSIANNGGKMGKVGTFELCDAADGLRDQLKLMEEASTGQPIPDLTVAIGHAVQQALDGSEFRDESGQTYYHLATQDAD